MSLFPSMTDIGQVAIYILLGTLAPIPSAFAENTSNKIALNILFTIVAFIVGVIINIIFKNTMRDKTNNK